MANKFIYGKKDGIRVNAKDLAKELKGKKCNCFCLECNESLLLIKGPIKKDFFRHKSDTNCSGFGESAIHFLAKEIIKNNNKIVLPDGDYFEYDPQLIAEKEVFLYSNLKPDVILQNNNDERIAIEIAYCHFKDEKEINIYKKNNQSAIEIDLSFIQNDIDYNELEEIILHNDDIRYFLHKYEEVIVETPAIQSNNIAPKSNTTSNRSFSIIDFIKENPILSIIVFIISYFTLKRVSRQIFS